MLSSIKVLLIGQLPVEGGGNYTTGAAKVVEALSRQQVDGIANYVYATNASAKKVGIKGSPAYYYGYRMLAGRMLRNILLHPFRTMREWKVYKRQARVNPLRYEFYKANFQKVLELVQPDLIHFNGSGIEPLHFANQVGIPVLFTCHGVFDRRVNPQSSERRYADHVTGLTSEAREEIKKYLCVDEDKISIIPNGVDSKLFHFSSEARKNVRAEQGAGKGTIVFITVASIQERKGQLRFCKVLKNIDVTDWEYWIVGKGPDEQAIRDYCEQEGISNKVKILGYKSGSELYKYYSAADVYAHVSTMEGQALCEIEAFSTGIKLLVNDKIKGTIAQSELESGDYLMFDIDKPDKDQLKRWLKNENAERKSNNTMDWHMVAERYAALYRKLLNK